MTRRAAATAFLFLTLATSSWAQRHPNQTRGLQPHQTFGYGAFDHTNVFNGGLIVQLPIGQQFHVNGPLSYSLSLVYPGNMWDYKKLKEGTVEYTKAMPNSRSNAGLGWQISLGWLIMPQNLSDTAARPTYISQDGAEHVFYSTLHGESVTGYNYTRDGSYIRMVLPTAAPGETAEQTFLKPRVIEFPDGLKQTFTSKDSAGTRWPDNEWRLTTITDRFNNVITISYSDFPFNPVGSVSQMWTISDVQRDTKVYFMRRARDTDRPDDTPANDRVLSAISVVARNGAISDTATYSFTYADSEIERGQDNDVTTNLRKQTRTVKVPLLQTVTLPDTSTYSMTYYTEYGNPLNKSGHLKSLTLPTRGQIAWDYDLYEFPQQSSGTVEFRKSVGVTNREETDPTTSDPARTWQYRQSLTPFFMCGTSEPYEVFPESRTAVKSPKGNWGSPLR